MTRTLLAVLGVDHRGPLSGARPRRPRRRAEDGREQPTRTGRSAAAATAVNALTTAATESRRPRSPPARRRERLQGAGGARVRTDPPESSGPRRRAATAPVPPMVRPKPLRRRATSSGSRQAPAPVLSGLVDRHAAEAHRLRVPFEHQRQVGPQLQHAAAGERAHGAEAALVHRPDRHVPAEEGGALPVRVEEARRRRPPGRRAHARAPAGAAAAAWPTRRPGEAAAVGQAAGSRGRRARLRRQLGACGHVHADAEHAWRTRRPAAAWR
jgi:hypothetical protein